MNEFKSQTFRCVSDEVIGGTDEMKELHKARVFLIFLICQYRNMMMMLTLMMSS